eukprot:RCo012770
MASGGHIELLPVTERSVEALRTLNAVIFPVVYQDKFYQQVVQNNCGYTFLAYLDDILVGTVCCRLERLSESKSDHHSKVYIMTLGVLAAYRRLKVGSKLLQKVLEVASKDPNVVEIELHVQTSNDEALAFYKSFGFEVICEVKDYYKRIEPPHAFLLRKATRGLLRTNGAWAPWAQ